MFILKKDRPNNSAEEWSNGWSRYQLYLKEVMAQLPTAACVYATADWHYNHMDHRAPHDAWVERVEFQEVSDGKGKRNRKTQLRVVLLGAYHDGYIELLYRGIKRYNIAASAIHHGDWLYDEVRLADGGHLVHEVEFENGEWWIECEDIEYEWKPIDSSNS